MFSIEASVWTFLSAPIHSTAPALEQLGRTRYVLLRRNHTIGFPPCLCSSQSILRCRYYW